MRKGDDNVHLSVSIKIADCHSRGYGTEAEVLRIKEVFNGSLKRAVAVAKTNHDGGTSGRGDEVEFAVGIEVNRYGIHRGR